MHNLNFSIFAMNMRKFLLFILVIVLAACGRMPSAEWTEGVTEDDGRALHTLVLHDVPEGSRVWFQELFDGKTSVEGPTMNHYQGTSWYIDIPESGTVTLKYYGRPLPRHSWAPEAFVLQQKGRADSPMEVRYHFLEHPKTENNEGSFVSDYVLQPADIIPQVSAVIYGTEPMERIEILPSLPEGWYRITI